MGLTPLPTADRWFVRYLRGRGHPSKLRIAGWLCNHVFKRVVADTESGRMVLDSSDLIQRALLFYGHFEPATVRLHRRLLRPGDTYVDVGANVGSFSLAASLAVGDKGKVVAIEPNPVIYARLIENQLLNPFSTNILNFNCAVSDQQGIAHLQLPPKGNSGQAKLSQTRREDTVEVRAERLPVLLAKARVADIRLLKIDIEGHEIPVLRDLFGAGIRPAHLILEFLPDDFPAHAAMPELLAQNGYVLQSVTGARFVGGALEENNVWARLIGTQ